MKTLKPTSMNHSPWIYQLERARPIHTLTGNQEVDLAIIGGGIAGVMSAYFILTHTSHSVILLDAGKIAHGATGHNAGQIVAYFERPFSEIVAEYGLELATKGLDDIRNTWDILLELQKNLALKTPIHITTGYAGCSSIEQLFLHLNNKYLRRQEGLNIESVLISEEHVQQIDIPVHFQDLCAFVPQSHILEKLETQDQSYIALLSTKKGCTNSALLCEEIIGYLISSYPDRFRISEETPVQTLILEKDHALLLTQSSTIIAGQTVLCTNGFENITIINTVGDDIDKHFHEEISGLTGYMAGYFDQESKPPSAISYFTTAGAEAYEPYYYVTRRPYEDRNGQHTLVCVGGPEEGLDDKMTYKKHAPVKEEALQALQKFIQHTYTINPKFAFTWHGLMGYTKNGLRLIGREPRNPILLYNLGCNGVGILTSIFGAKRISQFLLHHTLEKSIFDPK